MVKAEVSLLDAPLRSRIEDDRKDASTLSDPPRFSIAREIEASLFPMYPGYSIEKKGVLFRVCSVAKVYLGGSAMIISSESRAESLGTGFEI